MTEKTSEKTPEKTTATTAGKPAEKTGPHAGETTGGTRVRVGNGGNGGQEGAEAAAPGVLAQAEQAIEGWAGQLLPRSWGARAARAGSTIFVDEWREDAAWVVEAELPGVDPESDVTLRLDRHSLELAADRRSRAATTATSTRRELRSGRLTRSLPVPRGADPARASATYRDGILTVRVPLAPDHEPTPRALTVTRG